MPTATLPRPATSFVGRERELRELAGLLRDPEVRLLTVTGPGGCGKTRLALELARRVAAEFDDGAALVDLDAVATPSLVLAELAAALEVGPAADEAPAARLARALDERDALIVLDGFEHVVDAAADVGELVAATTRPAFLVTSREPLHVPGEHEYPLEPLAEDEAVSLFVRRARAVQPGFDGGAHRRAIEALVERLDRLPLAVELAAARVRLLPPEALLGRVSSALDLPAMHARGTPSRHRTLRAAVEWSYDTLDDRERCAFEALAVFRDGATLEAAETVAGAEVDVLASLVDKSLLRSRDGRAEPRFSMLATLRTFAAERLDARPDGEEVRRRQARWLAALLADCPVDRWRACEVAAWRRRVDDELPNIRAALDWATEHEPGTAAAIATWMQPYWSHRGLWQEGRERLRAILARDVLDEAERVPVVLAAGILAGYANDLDEADRYLAALASFLERAEPDVDRAFGILLRSWCAAFRGDAAEGARLARAGEAMAVALGDDSLRASSLNHLGIALFHTEPAVAREATRRAAELYAAQGSTIFARGARMNLALLDVVAGDVEAARTSFEQILAEGRAGDDRLDVLVAAINLGMCHVLLGRPDEAATHLLTWVDGSAELGNRRVAAELLYDVAGVAALRGHDDAVPALVGSADAIVEHAGQPLSGWEARVRTFALGRAAPAPERVAAGRAVSPQQALALARELLERPQRVERTFLFSDLVHSTALVEAVGDDAWVQLLAWHDRTLRTLFERFGGSEVDHAGDGFFVAFPAPREAIECACAVQRALERQRSEHGFAPLVRIGVHASAAVSVEGVYRGAGVHAAARIAAHAQGGEVVASADTVGGLALPVVRRESVELKGLGQPVELVVVGCA